MARASWSRFNAEYITSPGGTIKVFDTLTELQQFKARKGQLLSTQKNKLKAGELIPDLYLSNGQETQQITTKLPMRIFSTQAAMNSFISQHSDQLQNGELLLTIGETQLGKAVGSLQDQAKKLFNCITKITEAVQTIIEELPVIWEQFQATDFNEWYEEFAAAGICFRNYWDPYWQDIQALENQTAHENDPVEEQEEEAEEEEPHMENEDEEEDEEEEEQPYVQPPHHPE